MGQSVVLVINAALLSESDKATTRVGRALTIKIDKEIIRQLIFDRRKCSLRSIRRIRKDEGTFQRIPYSVFLYLSLSLALCLSLYLSVCSPMSDCGWQCT